MRATAPAPAPVSRLMQMFWNRATERGEDSGTRSSSVWPKNQRTTDHGQGRTVPVPFCSASALELVNDLSADMGVSPRPHPLGSLFSLEPNRVEEKVYLGDFGPCNSYSRRFASNEFRETATFLQVFATERVQNAGLAQGPSWHGLCDLNSP